MPKRLYKCEICGHRKSLESKGKKQIVCVDCVERDLLALDNRIKKLEKQFVNAKTSESQGEKKNE